MALADKAKALALQSRPLGGQDPADTGDVGNGSKPEKLAMSICFPLYPRLCCKTNLPRSACKIDSRLGLNAQR